MLGLLRIVVALLFLQYGLTKLIGFPDHGPPSLNGMLTAAALIETVGSLFVIVGLFTRAVAVLLSGEMAAAYFMVHAPQGFFPILNHGDLAVLFCFVFLYLAFAGGGKWTLDRALWNLK